MALKDDARALSREVTEVGAQLAGCAERLGQIADLIPTPDEARVRVHTPVVGEKIGRRDMEGKKLRVGDYVQVYNSDRYGNPRGTVIGPGPDAGDGKKRVEIRLDDGWDAHYTPSCERVERLQKGKDRPVVTASGRVLTDEDCERLADEAERPEGENGTDTPAPEGALVLVFGIRPAEAPE